MNREFRESLLFLLPLLVLISLFILIPVIGALIVSLWRDVTFLPARFIGLGNYSRILSDPLFFSSAAFTLLFSFLSVALEIMVGVIIALVINERLRFRAITRGMVLLPWVIPSVIGGRIWELIYRYDYGLANYVLGNIFGVRINWFGDSVSAFFSLVVADVWRTAPFVTIIILAGLQSMPEDIHKQAKIDGAGIFDRFSKITVPHIKPFIIVALLFRLIDALRVFDIIYVITGGGPGGATTSLSLYAYEYFLLGDFGYGSAVSFVLFLIALAIALSIVKLGKLREGMV